MRAVRLCAVALWLGVSPAFAQISSVLVVSGLSSPVAVVKDPTQANVLFVVEQIGRIRVVHNGTLDPTPFLDLTTVVLSGGERGLLGLAFAPDYATSGRFFVNYTRKPDGNTVVARYRRSDANPLRADPASRHDLQWPGGNTSIGQPFANHNAGDLAFGSDGYLYIPLGDGGSGNDPDHRAQNPAVLLGKMLRIDVDVPDGDAVGYVVPPDNPFVGHTGFLPEIWAFGLRNPFRFTVDEIARGGTGAIVIGDVGQDAWEEIDYEPFGVGGRNYGWRDREGAHSNVTTKPAAFLPLTDPITEYSHSSGNSVIGGVVYRGTGLGVGFFGRYFFADFGARRIWSMRLVINPTTHQATATQLIEHTNTLGGSNVIGKVTGFGLGANCEVYFVNWSGGELRRIVNAGGPAAQCPTSPDPFLSSGGGVFIGRHLGYAGQPARCRRGTRGAGLEPERLRDTEACRQLGLPEGQLAAAVGAATVGRRHRHRRHGGLGRVHRRNLGPPAARVRRPARPSNPPPTGSASTATGCRRGRRKTGGRRRVRGEQAARGNGRIDGWQHGDHHVHDHQTRPPTGSA